MSNTSIPSGPTPPTETDVLIERCLAGDQEAWGQIVRTHWRKVFNLAYKFVGRHDEAEDLAQDVFLKLFKSLKTNRPSLSSTTRVSQLRLEHLAVAAAPCSVVGGNEEQLNAAVEAPSSE